MACPAAVKTSVKQNKVKDRTGSYFLVTFYEVPSKLEIHHKKGMYFLFDFTWYLVQLDIGHWASTKLL